MARTDDDGFSTGKAAVSTTSAGSGDPHPTAELPQVPGPARSAWARRGPNATGSSDGDSGGGADGGDGDRVGGDGGRVADKGRDAAGGDDRRPVERLIPVQVRGGFFRGLFFLAATAAVIVAILLGLQAAGMLPRLHNPFADRTTDRTGPVLLKSIQDMSRFVAAEGNFEVVVDVQKDKTNIPEFLLNDRILFVAAGSVQAYVDFARIDKGAISESADHTTVEISLPAPQLDKPNLNNDKSYVYAEQRGLLNRFADLVNNDPNRLQEMYKAAEQRIATAAKESGLAERALENTRKMLDGMLRSLGYTSVTINFASP